MNLFLFFMEEIKWNRKIIKSFRRYENIFNYESVIGKYFSRNNKKRVRKNNIQKEILYCIYTRSCNGYIREKYLKELLKLDFDYWAIPFIVKLSDEYIVEILEVIYDKLKIRNNDDIKRFCLENKNIINKSYSRMISYWNEFYRSKEPSFHKYIKKILKESLFFS